MATPQKKNRPSLWQRLWRLIVILQRVVLAVFILLPLVLIAAMWLLRPQPEVEKDVALVWAPQGVLVEHTDTDIRQALQQEFIGDKQPITLMRDLVESLDRAAVDPRIKALFLKVDQMDYAGMAQLEELAAAIRRFKLSGKPVFTHAGQFSQAQYYLAAQADEVFLDPLGAVWIDGFGLYKHYFKDALDKLEVDIHVFRVGAYKSAIEPFIRNDMSPEARTANREWLATLWSVYGQGISETRELGEGAVDDYANRFAEQLVALQGNSARLALNTGLVDKLMTREEMRSRIRQEVGRDEDHGSFRQIDHRRYLWATRSEDLRDKKRDPEGQVALVVAEGALVEGDMGQGTVDGEELAWHIGKARRNDDIKAVVLRIDSPGGSVAASEAVRRAIKLTQEAGKPVIASMSSVAASGGYWIAMQADEIWAQASTVTGSIGVFGLLPTIDKSLAKMGIHTDGVGTTSLSGALRPDRPLSPRLEAAVQATVENYYRVFVDHVAETRGLSDSAAERVAQGRVWSGADAKRLGLVDQMGGLREAADAAAKRADLKPDEYKLTPMQRAMDWRVLLLERFSGFMSSMGLQNSNWLQRGLQWLGQQAGLHTLGLAWIAPGQGVYAHCLCRPDVNGVLHPSRRHNGAAGIQ